MWKYKKYTTYKVKITNITHKTVVKNTYVAFQHTGIQHATIGIGNQVRYLSQTLHDINLMFLFICFLKLFVLFVSSIQSYLLTKQTKTVYVVSKNRCKLSFSKARHFFSIAYRQGKHNNQMLKASQGYKCMGFHRVLFLR